jgi:hypothetical protein
MLALVFFAVMAIGLTMVTVASSSVYSKAALSLCFSPEAAHIDARCKLEVPRGPACAMLRGVGLGFVKVVTLPHGS